MFQEAFMIGVIGLLLINMAILIVRITILTSLEYAESSKTEIKQAKTKVYFHLGFMLVIGLVAYAGTNLI